MPGLSYGNHSAIYTAQHWYCTDFSCDWNYFSQPQNIFRCVGTSILHKFTDSLTHSLTLSLTWYFPTSHGSNFGHLGHSGHFGHYAHFGHFGHFGHIWHLVHFWHFIHFWHSEHFWHFKPLNTFETLDTLVSLDTSDPLDTLPWNKIELAVNTGR